MRVVDEAVRWSGRPADAVASAPGRVTVIGEHLDYNGGLALPMAIPLRTYTAVTLRGDGAVRVRSLQLPEEAAVAPRERATGWAAYVVGVLAELRREGLRVPGMDVLVDGEVPLGSGLSSSAALEVAVATAVLAALGIPGDEVGVDGVDVVDVCVRAENLHAGAPTGRMDQAIAVHGRAGHALLVDFATGARRLVRWSPPGSLLVVDTGVRHDHAAGEYAARRRECQEAAAQVGVEHLALAAAADLGALSPVLRARARHVVSEQARVTAFTDAVADADWSGAGELMTASHVSLRDDFEVSCAELDVAVAAALDAGALGARMTGGGFGGCAIALAPPGRADVVRSAVRAAYASRGWEQPTFYAGAASDGARVEHVSPSVT